MTRPHPRGAPRAPSGFTLIEILMVVAITAIMTAIVGARFRITPNTEIQLAAMQLAQDIDFSRTRALAARSRVEFVFRDAVDPPTYVAYLDVDRDSTINETEYESRAMRGFGTRELPVRVAFGRGGAPAAPGDVGSGALSFSGGRLAFDARGTVTPFGAGGTAYLVHESDPSVVAAVVVAPSGGVRVWTYRNGSWE